MELQIKTEDLGDVELVEADFVDVPSENGLPPETAETNTQDLSRYAVKFCQGEYHWTEKRIFDMIKLYKEYTEQHSVNPGNKKPMWDYIAAKMRQLGHEKCTSNHVQNKYKTLTRQYRIVCDHNAIPGKHHRSFPFFDAMSEVYKYTPSNHTGLDDLDTDDECSGSQKLTSLLVNINKDKKEQEEKKLEKLELMHREKMDMFSSFLKNVSKTTSESPTSTRTSKRLSSYRKRSTFPSDELTISDDSDIGESSPQKYSTKRPSNNKKSKTLSQPASELASLITKMNEERKAREEMKMCRLEKMHDEKMKMFSAFLDVIKKIKK